MENSTFAITLITWYRENQRDLPWRNTRDPYRIWMSEIILQQTRVSQGLPYYLAFCENFPTVTALATAPEQQVLRLWQGLGYYSRARNLHKCAQKLVSDHDGRFPETFEELIRLPGIGVYTAAAIASIAFQQPVAAIDGNVFRVLSRIYGIEEDIARSGTRKTFNTLSRELMSGSPPDQFNQALMEFGALHCTPARPKCDSCPFSPQCHAYKLGRQSRYPVKSRQTVVRKRYFYYFVVKSGPYFLMKKRQNKDIWQGLYDFFMLESEREVDYLKLLEQGLPGHTQLNEVEVHEPSPVYRHKLTHQLIEARFVPLELQDAKTLRQWKKYLQLEQFELDEIGDLPKPILIDNYLRADIF